MKRTKGLSFLILATLFIGLLGFTPLLFAQKEHGGKEQAQLTPPPAAPVSAPAEKAAAPVEETVLLDDSVPPGAKSEGNWVWDTTTAASGKKSHGHPSAKGLQSHGYTADPISFPANGMLTQQVWLDPADPPKGIMLKFKLATGDEVGVYWEGEEEVFNPGEEEEVWYYGLLPELGKWNSLEVLVEDLGLEAEKVVGISFMTFDGRALWDKTVLTQAPAEEATEALPELPTPPGAPAGEEE